MATPNDKVMQMVERELKKNPDITNDQLQKKAAKINSAIGKLTLRQFHARYPLQVKRRRGSGKRKTRRTGGRRKTSGRGRRSARAASTAKPAAARDRVRAILWDFAKDVSAADGKAETIDVLTRADKYVDRVVKAVDRGR